MKNVLKNCFPNNCQKSCKTDTDIRKQEGLHLSKPQKHDRSHKYEEAISKQRRKLVSYACRENENET